MENKQQRHEHDELDSLITDALAEEFASAKPRKDRATFMASIRTAAAQRQQESTILADAADLPVSQERLARERAHKRVRNLFETIAQITGPKFDHMR